METFPDVITFRITSRCNYDCKYCLAPKNIEELKFDKLKEIFNLFSKNGAKAVVLTGGEPLIREDIEKIILDIKRNNLKIFLDTNGSLFFKNNKLIENNVDVLGLPVDFINSSYRNKEQFEAVIKILEYYKNKGKKPLIRIGTVVTRDNLKELEKIGNLLKNYPIDIWKIYEFLPQNKNAVDNKAVLEISRDMFKDETNKILNKF